MEQEEEKKKGMLRNSVPKESPHTHFTEKKYVRI
jgi:hypothetical protein